MRDAFGVDRTDISKGFLKHVVLATGSGATGAALAYGAFKARNKIKTTKKLARKDRDR